jgi:hypothetical protein
MIEMGFDMAEMMDMGFDMTLVMEPGLFPLSLANTPLHPDERQHVKDDEILSRTELPP